MARSLLPAIVCVLAVHAPVVSAQPAGESLAALPLLEQPSIAVDAVGLRQSGRHLELAGLLTNKSSRLDAREATITLIGFGANGEMLTQRTLELVSIPAATTVAVSVALELENDARIARAEAHVGLLDAPMLRAQPPIALEPADVAVRVDRTGQLSVTGRVAPGRSYPVAYRVDAVVVDEKGAIVGSARLNGLRIGTEPTAFAAKGIAPPGIDGSRLRAIVTILPGSGEP